jgi:Uma2 family endonuclease
MEQNVDIAKSYSLSEYIRIDEIGPTIHEFDNGNLSPIGREPFLHNEFCLNFFLVLRKGLSSEYEIYVRSVKLNIEGENKYVYPDITVIKEQPSADLRYKDYIIYQPLLIAEVLSDSTRKYDLTDKFILYQKISSLQYYIVAEPEKHLVILYEKNREGEWTAKTFTELSEVISLLHLDAQISLSDIYKK